MKKMKCPDCDKVYKSKWVKIGLNRKRLVLICGCKERKSTKLGFSFHRYKDATAFGYDRSTGKPVALDKKGNRISPTETRYNFKNDPHGWRAMGLKVRDKDERGRSM